MSFKLSNLKAANLKLNNLYTKLLYNNMCKEQDLENRKFKGFKKIHLSSIKILHAIMEKSFLIQQELVLKFGAREDPEYSSLIDEAESLIELLLREHKMDSKARTTDSPFEDDQMQNDERKNAEIERLRVLCAEKDSRIEFLQSQLQRAETRITFFQAKAIDSIIRNNQKR